MRARLAAAAAAAVLLTGCAGTAVDELPPSALESMEALAAFAREQNDGELAPVVSTPHQHKIEHFVVLLKVGLEVACSVLPSLKKTAVGLYCRPERRATAVQTVGWSVTLSTPGPSPVNRSRCLLGLRTSWPRASALNIVVLNCTVLEAALLLTAI